LYDANRDGVLSGAEVTRGPLADVRAEIEHELRTQQGQKRYAEAAEQFTNLVYEQADSLQPAADKLGLKIATRDNVPRSGLPATPNQPQLLNARVVESLFSDDSLKNHHNTQAIEVAPSTLVSARVVEHRPAAIRPLEEVKGAIRQRLEREEASKLARAAGEEKLAELIKQPNDSGFSPVLTVSRRAPQGLPANLLKEVLSTHADKLPTFVGAEVAGAGYLIANVVSAKETAAQPPAQREAEQRALQRQAAAADEVAYAEGLRARHKAQVLRPEFQREPSKAEAADGKSASY